MRGCFFGLFFLLFLSVPAFCGQYVKVFRSVQNSLRYQTEASDEFAGVLRNLIAQGYRVVSFSIDYASERRQMTVVYEDSQPVAVEEKKEE